MTDLLRGMFGAAVVYIALWYGVAPAPARTVAPNSGVAERSGTVEAQPTEAQPTEARQASQAGVLGSHSPGGAVEARPPAEHRSPEAVAARQVQPAAAAPPMATTSFDGAAYANAPAAAPGKARPPQLSDDEMAALARGELPENLSATIQRMSELQDVAGDPRALAERVQKLETSPDELARLKEFARRFVDLPLDRHDAPLPGSSQRPASRRQAPRR